MSVFTHDGPVHGQGKFFGREVLIRSLFSGLERGRSFAVIGGPKSGRSSVLAQLAMLLEQRWERDPNAVKTVPVYYDLSMLESRKAMGLASELWAAIVPAVCNAKVFGQAEPVRPPEPTFVRGQEAWTVLREACRELWKSLTGSTGWCRFILMLDNGDRLAEHELSELQEPLAELASSDAAGSPHAIVIAGGRQLREQLLDEHCPLAPLRPLFVGALRESEAKSLLRAGFPGGEPSWLEPLLGYTGCHPYLLQRLLAEFESCGEASRLDDAAQAAEEDTLAWAEASWRQMDLDRGVTYRGAYAAPEHALMQYLLDFGNPIDIKTAEREMGIRPLKEYAELLCYLGIAELVLKGDVSCFRAPCEAWNMWYRQRILA